MKISDTNVSTVSTGAQQGIQQTTNGHSRGTNSANNHGRDDRAQLSSLSSVLQTYSSGSPERDAKVNHLASAYQSGNYVVDSRAVGKSIMAEAALA